MWWRLSLLGVTTVALVACAFASITVTSPPVEPGIPRELGVGTTFYGFDWVVSGARLLLAAGLLLGSGVLAWRIGRSARGAAAIGGSR